MRDHFSGSLHGWEPSEDQVDNILRYEAESLTADNEDNITDESMLLTAFHLWFHIRNQSQTSILRAKIIACSLLPGYFTNIMTNIVYTNSAWLFTRQHSEG